MFFPEVNQEPHSTYSSLRQEVPIEVVDKLGSVQDYHIAGPKPSQTANDKPFVINDGLM